MLLQTKKIPPLVYANTITPKEITWLWWPYIPAGSASMVFGPGGSGKSHIAIDIAARISQGQALPQQKKALPAQNVLIMSAEDEFDRVLVPRLIKAGADLNRIAFPKTTFTLDREGLRAVETYMETMTAGIVFIDPIVAYIGGKVDINRANETREFTGGLHQMAMRTGAAIIVVHHSRKGQDGLDFEKAMGSADFNNSVRSVLYTTVAPDGSRIMRHVKSNYSALGSTLAYDFGDKGFEWTGVFDEAGLMVQSRGSKASAIQDWLKERLAAGPKRAIDMENSGQQRGYSHMALVRAKVGVAESYLVHEDNKMSWYWRLLPDKEQSDGVEADVPVMDSQWGPENQGRVEREIHAREAERTGANGHAVGARGPRAARARGKPQSPEEQLDQWAKELLK